MKNASPDMVQLRKEVDKAHDAFVARLQDLCLVNRELGKRETTIHFAIIEMSAEGNRTLSDVEITADGYGGATDDSGGTPG